MPLFAAWYCRRTAANFPSDLLPFYFIIVINYVNERSVTTGVLKNMTRDDIVKAAFKVWGRDLYRTTSLSEIARELGVSKPALYRHFKDKNALLEVMFTVFFDDCAAFIKNGHEKAVNTGDKRESYLIWLRTITEYYARNRDFFIFSLVRVFSTMDRLSLNKEFLDRGIDFGHSALSDRVQAVYPSKMQLGMATSIFCIGQLHRNVLKKGEIPTEEQVKSSVLEVERLVTQGLCLDAGKLAALDYQNLEKRAAGTEYGDAETNALLKAVAGAVAEAGPWSASMEMVAKRSGLSKSGLYAHFKNKQDMLVRLFISEFTTIVKFAKAQVESSDVSEEQLYLTIISITNYLRSRPEILVALDWIKSGRLDLGDDVPAYLYREIGTIKFEAIRNYDRNMLVRVAQWVIFMIVNTLALWRRDENAGTGSAKKQNHDISWARNASEIPNESFRTLFRFIALGLEGLN